MRTYIKSKKKVVALIIACSAILLSPAAISLFFGMFARRTSWMFAIVPVIPVLFIQLNRQFKQSIQIDCHNLFFHFCSDKAHNPPCDVKITYIDVTKLTCKGTKIVPMSEMLVVETKSEKIYVDFNFERYLELWNEIYLKCKEQNPNVIVSNKLEKRIQSFRKKKF